MHGPERFSLSSCSRLVRRLLARVYKREINLPVVEGDAGLSSCGLKLSKALSVELQSDFSGGPVSRVKLAELLQAS